MLEPAKSDLVWSCKSCAILTSRTYVTSLEESLCPLITVASTSNYDHVILQE